MKFGMPHVVRDCDRHGRLRYYVRIVGKKKVKLKAEPGTNAFLEEYQTALDSLKAEKPKKADVGTMRWLVREFENSHTFQKVTQREQRGRHQLVQSALEELVKFVNPNTKQPETWIEFKPGKTSKSTGKVLTLPMLPQLAASIEAIPTKGLTTFLLTTHHKPHATGDSFANWFKDRVREAGLPDHCSPHGLRKAGACRAADNGATEKQMMAIFGWSTSALAAYYAQKANEKKLAGSAVHLLTKQ
jgi:hypothetical protein